MTRSRWLRFRGPAATWACAACVLLIARGSQAGYELVWADEFDGAKLDPLRWSLQLGDGCPALCGWGNAELQYYRAQNAEVAGGLLRIIAREESVMGYAYTSARLRTKGLADFSTGRIEMRARMPVGQGLWPAFWMLPSDEVYGGWAASGEIDVVEYVGQEPDRVIGTLHYGAPWPGNVSSSNEFVLASGGFDQGFHDFAVEWDRCEMRWSVDGVPYATQNAWGSTGGPYPAPFDQPFHLLLNMAVGGNLPGPPDPSTSFPQTYVVDHVRVSARDDHPTCQLRFDDMEHAAPFSNGWFEFGGSVGGGGISANPSASAPVGDGCQASLTTGWGSGGTPGFFGGFGRTAPLDPSGMTHFRFWIDPDAGQDYTLEINLQDDDDGDDAIPGVPDGADDEFQAAVVVSPLGPDAISGGGWQEVSIPLSAFVDDNSFHFGGNGVFDPTPTGAGGNGRLVNVVIAILGNSGADVNFDTDDWRFTQEESAAGGRVFEDANANGVLDGGDHGLPGATVELRDGGGSLVDTAFTAEDGRFAFTSLPWGEYTFEVDPASLPEGLGPSHDADGVATPHVATLLLGCSTANGATNFGYAPGTGVPVLPPRAFWLLALGLSLLSGLALRSLAVGHRRPAAGA